MDDATQMLLQQLLDGQTELTKTVNNGFKEHGERLAKIETQVAPLVSDASFKRKVDYIKTGLAGSIGAGIVMAFRFLFPHTPTLVK
ncbi:MAG TPA: hypothetical protein VFA89_20875 [Terriglobales bacterium]|nr:hypothetical protein [Terriglobales bacterium]